MTGPSIHREYECHCRTRGQQRHEHPGQQARKGAEQMGLTARDIEILRAADTITFHGHHSIHQLIARLSYQNPHNTTGHDQDHAIPVFGYVVMFSRSEEKEPATTLAVNARAFAMVSASPLTKTWASLLRPSDGPSWSGGRTTPATSYARWTWPATSCTWRSTGIAASARVSTSPPASPPPIPATA
jgi:hypothetical protein